MKSMQFFWIFLVLYAANCSFNPFEIVKKILKQKVWKKLHEKHDMNLKIQNVYIMGLRIPWWIQRYQIYHLMMKISLCLPPWKNGFVEKCTGRGLKFCFSDFDRLIEGFKYSIECLFQILKYLDWGFVKPSIIGLCG